MTQREKELRERLLAKRKQSANSSPAPVPIAPSPSAVEAAEVLDSISKQIEMLDQEGSEEGEIEEDPKIDQPPTNIPPLDSQADQPVGKKRKHNDGQSSKLSTGQKADKKARKKSKKAAKAAAVTTAP